MFTRQKYLLNYLIVSKGKSKKLALVKGLFLLCKEGIEKNIYDFHPYKYGPFSEVLYADLRTLERKGFIRQSSTNIRLTLNKKQTGKMVDNLPSEDFDKINLIADKCNKWSFEEVLTYVYKKYPYYAIRNPKKNDSYREHDPTLQSNKQTPQIFTIGYEGISIDEFINQMIRNNIQILVDVRANPRSMKYGFNGNRLQNIIENQGMQYLSIPSLGIKSENRQDLNSFEDYQKLFADFETNQMPQVENELEELKKLLKERKRIALMCFEKDINYCHREVVSRHLHHHCNQEYELIHII